jgi:uncharacterized protein (TIGR03437 family)
LWADFPASAQSAGPSLTLVVTNETAPAGGSVQIKVFAAAPCRITSGTLVLRLDFPIFGGPSDAMVFSANGDAWGSWNIYNRVYGQFTSPSGGIGQLPGLPVLVQPVSVAAGLAKGTTANVTLDLSASYLYDLNGNLYSITAIPGTITIGGTLSIQSVTPGGGPQLVGTVIRIAGTGFDASTTATLDGLSIAPPQLMSPHQIDLTLGSTAELTGRRLHLANAAGEQADYFCSLPQGGLIFPLTTFETVSSPYPQGHARWFVVLNQTSFPVTVTAWEFALGLTDILGSATVEPGDLYLPEPGDEGEILYLTASAPIRMMACINTTEGAGCSPPTPTSGAIATLPSSPVSWNWQVGTPQPQATNLGLPAIRGGPFYSASVSPSAQQWLTAQVSLVGLASALTLTPNATGLKPGTYMGTVTVTLTVPASSALPPVDPGIIPVTLVVSSAPFIVPWGDAPVDFEAVAGGPSPSSQQVRVFAAADSSEPVQVQAAVQTDSGGNWLSVTPSSYETPGLLTAKANSTGLAAGTYTGRISVQGPANTVIVPAQLFVDPVTPPVSPASISFTGEAGNASPKAVSLTVQQGSGYSVSVQTQSGGNWLSATGNANSFTVAANTAGLAAGTYQGTVVLTSPSRPTLQVPVTLNLLAPPARLSVSPASLSFTALPNQTVVQSLIVASPGASGVFTCTLSSYPWQVGLSAGLSGGCSYGNTAATPAVVQVQVSAQWPGTYSGSVILQWTGGSVTVPFALGVTASSVLAPVLAGIVNSASETPGPISPGEMITLFGAGIGPAPTGFALDASGKVPVDLANTEVIIDGQAAPILYASATQVNAIVPYDAGTTGTATVQAVCNGFHLGTWTVPLAPAAPGIFTAGSTGVGQAAALNQDGSANSASNPAARGSAIQLFGTGEGQTSPANVTGGVTGSGNSTTQPVTVTIGGIDAAVTYHGSAPGEVAGVFQVDAVVPAGVTPGPAVPVIISVGGQPSQGGIAIAVR